MIDARQSRRGLLQAAGALIGGGTALSFASAAGAWSIESVSPDSATGLAYSNRCGGASEHAALQSRLRIALTHDRPLRRCRQRVQFAVVRSWSAARPLCT